MTSERFELSSTRCYEFVTRGAIHLRLHQLVNHFTNCRRFTLHIVEIVHYIATFWDNPITHQLSEVLGLLSWLQIVTVSFFHIAI